uniref:DNA pilot protein n=1 Tax=Dulem virus 227 TaxID=3145704 RepID=A0AAU8B471_9VIRU
MSATAAIIGAAGSAAGGLLSNILNYKSNRDTNKLNFELNERNNALARELANQKYDKDLEQWNRQNAYNTPAAQVERLRAAGLNPALSQISSGIVSSSPEMAQVTPTAATANPMSPVDMSGFDSMFNLPQTIANLKSVQADVEGKSIDNMTRHLKNLAGLDKLRSESNSVNLKNKYQSMQNSVFDSLYNMDMRLKESELDMRKSQLQFNITQNALKTKELDAFDYANRITIANSIADLSQKIANTSLTKQQIRYLVTQDAGLREAIKGTKLDNRQKAAVMRYVISEAASNARIAYFGVNKAYYDSLPDGEARFNEYYKKGGSFIRGLFDFGDLMRQISPIKFNFGRK